MASQHIRKYPVPGSFQDLLKDFTREILRNQPENVYDFGVAYFTAMENGEELRYGMSQSQMEEEMAQQQQQENNMQIPEMAPGRGVGGEQAMLEALLGMVRLNYDHIMQQIAQMNPDV